MEKGKAFGNASNSRTEEEDDSSVEIVRVIKRQSPKRKRAMPKHRCAVPAEVVSSNSSVLSPYKINTHGKKMQQQQQQRQQQTRNKSPVVVEIISSSSESDSDDETRTAATRPIVSNKLPAHRPDARKKTMTTIHQKRPPPPISKQVDNPSGAATTTTSTLAAVNNGPPNRSIAAMASKASGKQKTTDLLKSAPLLLSTPTNNNNNNGKTSSRIDQTTSKPTGKRRASATLPKSVPPSSTTTTITNYNNNNNNNYNNNNAPLPSTHTDNPNPNILGKTSIDLTSTALPKSAPPASTSTSSSSKHSDNNSHALEQLASATSPKLGNLGKTAATPNHSIDQTSSKPAGKQMASGLLKPAPPSSTPTDNDNNHAQEQLVSPKLGNLGKTAATPNHSIKVTPSKPAGNRKASALLKPAPPSSTPTNNKDNNQAQEQLASATIGNLGKTAATPNHSIDLTSSKPAGKRKASGLLKPAPPSSTPTNNKDNNHAQEQLASAISPKLGNLGKTSATPNHSIDLTSSKPAGKRKASALLKSAPPSSTPTTTNHAQEQMASTTGPKPGNLGKSSQQQGQKANPLPNTMLVHSWKRPRHDNATPSTAPKASVAAAQSQSLTPDPGRLRPHTLLDAPTVNTIRSQKEAAKKPPTVPENAVPIARSSARPHETPTTQKIAPGGTFQPLSSKPAYRQFASRAAAAIPYSQPPTQSQTTPMHGPATSIQRKPPARMNSQRLPPPHVQNAKSNGAYPPPFFSPIQPGVGASVVGNVPGQHWPMGNTGPHNALPAAAGMSTTTRSHWEGQPSTTARATTAAQALQESLRQAYLRDRSLARTRAWFHNARQTVVNNNWPPNPPSKHAQYGPLGNVRTNSNLAAAAAARYPPPRAFQSVTATLARVGNVDSRAVGPNRPLNDSKRKATPGGSLATTRDAQKSHKRPRTTRAGSRVLREDRIVLKMVRSGHGNERVLRMVSRPVSSKKQKEIKAAISILEAQLGSVELQPPDENKPKGPGCNVLNFESIMQPIDGCVVDLPLDAKTGDGYIVSWPGPTKRGTNFYLALPDSVARAPVVGGKRRILVVPPGVLPPQTGSGLKGRRIVHAKAVLYAPGGLPQDSQNFARGSNFAFPAKRERGRPRRDTSAPARRGKGRPPKDTGASVKRGRGRPRKDATSSPVKRGKGRPAVSPKLVTKTKEFLSPGKYWRDFKKSSSRVGRAYQATSLPRSTDWERLRMDADTDVDSDVVGGGDG